MRIASSRHALGIEHRQRKLMPPTWRPQWACRAQL
jgi:hypothetical protein